MSVLKPATKPIAGIFPGCSTRKACRVAPKSAVIRFRAFGRVAAKPAASANKKEEEVFAPDIEEYRDA